MKIQTHRNSTTTRKIREEIRKSDQTINMLAKKYALSWNTVHKWKVAENTEDKSSKPKTLRTDLREVEEEKICFLRKQFKYTIDEIYLMMEEEFKDRKIYPMKIYRCLKRNGLNVLPKEFVEAERKIKKFKKYGIGYLHIDFIHTRRVNKKKYYVFTCIDRVSKLAFVILTNTHKVEESVRFLEEVIKYYPYKINYILTDNGSEFTDKGYLSYDRNKTTKKHKFIQKCKEEEIELRQTKFKSPWTNGMVERFNRKIQEKVIRLRIFETPESLGEDLIKYINKYNFEIKLKGLQYKTPIDYLKENIPEFDSNILIQTHTTYRY